MKETPKEIKIHNNLKTGIISIDGFLGDDRRHFHEIIETDRKRLRQLNITCEELVEKMEYFTDIAFEHYDGPVIVDDHYDVEYRSYRGKLICPFAHQGFYRKGEVFLHNRKNGIRICWTPLNIHMFREHGFLEGEGSKHRLDPELLYKALFE